jgi:hypothetical protein
MDAGVAFARDALSPLMADLGRFRPRFDPGKEITARLAYHQARVKVTDTGRGSVAVSVTLNGRPMTGTGTDLRHAQFRLLKMIRQEGE